MLQELINIGSSLLGANSANQANRTNIRLQQNAQKFEERMSNTAVQRRADDIQNAGGNRALAFTNGSEASTPSIQPAKVEPIPYNAPDITSAKLVRAQMQKTMADIGLTTAQTRVADVTARNIEQQTTGGIATAQKTQQETENLRVAKDKLLAELQGVLTSNQLAELDRQLKSATLADAIRLVQTKLKADTLGLSTAAQKAKVADAKSGFMDYMRDRLNELKQPFHFWPNGKAPQAFKRNSGQGKFLPQRRGR